MPLTIGNTEFFMGPHQTGAPDDLLAAIVDFIDGAKKKLYIAVQELDEKVIAEAIIRAKQRSVTVKLVLEADYLTVSRAVKNPFKPGGTNEHNRMLHDAVLRAKIDVHSDFNSKIFHQKFMVRDGSSVLTGSTNFTTTGVTKNLNHLVIIHDIKIANIYKKEFREIQQGHFGKLNEGHDERPKKVVVSDMPVKVLFAPDHSPEMEIMKQMTKGQKRIDFAIFTFSKSSGIDDTMLKCLQSGMSIHGAMDGQAANQHWAPTKTLKQAGATLSIIPSSKTIGKLHHKLMVIDEQVVILGSFNYTGPANKLNDENIVIIGDLDAGQTTASIKKQKQFAAYAKDEIDRIIADHGKPA